MKWIFTVGCFASLAVPGYGALEIEPKEVATLRGPDARLQVVVTQDGADATRAVEYRVEPAGALQVDAAGHVKPLLNGAAKVIAQCEGEAAVEVDVLVESLEEAPPINFKNQIVPTFTKLGCNGGGCHGKVEGQNGFRLSLLGFEPTEDYEYLVKEARGRRIFPAAPEYSLLLRKATGELPHGGGGRLERDTPAYQKIVRWIEQGMPYGLESDPFVEKVEVFPKERMLEAGDFQQLRVTAFYSDGTTEDVTRVVSYEANVPEMAECSPEGLVEAGSMTGSVAVMVRFHELVDVARLTVPLGAPVESLPLAKGTLDEHVFVTLKKLGVPPSEPCDDATFLRRVTIDIAGRIPTQAETDAFLADAAGDKRSGKIEEL
ncbi:MAG: DUF1549 domain-containing protein, partial [Verrucomicrobiales bacterium]|nr:DUF1549 domain-containing protein [Verrucomicrobiales bacterium]